MKNSVKRACIIIAGMVKVAAVAAIWLVAAVLIPQLR